MDESLAGENELRLSYRLPGGGLHEARIVIADGRLFTLVAASPDGEDDSRRFLDSFQSRKP